MTQSLLGHGCDLLFGSYSQTNMGVRWERTHDGTLTTTRLGFEGFLRPGSMPAAHVD